MLMNNKPILTLVLFAGCNAGDVVPGEVEQLTEGEGGGYGDSGESGDTGGGVPNPDECWFDDAPAGAVRWQCEGLAEATVFATLHVEVPDWLDNAEFIQKIIDGGRLDWYSLFGPWNGEAYDDPGIDACCSPGVVGNGEEGSDETGADPTEGDDDSLPQPAMACAHDCADQACREVPDTLRDIAAQIPAGVPAIGPSYRNQLRELADWVAGHQQDCWEAMVTDGVHELGAAYVINGEWQVPNSNAWPDVTELSVRGGCKIYDWYLPEDGEPQACTGLNDNNGEEPFGSGGPLGGFDTFAPTGGEMRLDGPVVFGVPATGTAPILGLGDECPRGECSRLDAWVAEDVLELRRMVMVAPSSMSWEQDGMRLTVDGLHAMVEHPISIPLVADGNVMRFEIPAGQLEVLFAGQVHGVPVKVEVPNATPVTGMVFPLFDGSHGIVVDPFTVEHHDVFGSWTMHMELGELVALDHAPRATFEVQDDGSNRHVDASASFDPDGDALTFEWYRDGSWIGEGPVMESEPAADGSALTLKVTDETGRTTWSNGLSTEGS
jgi:hypothetical protein